MSNLPFWALHNENMMEYLMLQQMFPSANQQPNANFANYFFWDMLM
jgi:hypothetical protein